MRVGLLADSAGNLELLDRAFGLLAGPLHCERVFFLGGAYSDVDAVLRNRRGAATESYSDTDFLQDVQRFVELGQQTSVHSGEAIGSADVYGVPVVRVPERDSAAYTDGATPSKIIEMVDNQIALLVHFKGDLAKDEIANAAIILHGGSAEAAAVQIGTRAFVTPGALSHDPPTVGVLTVTGNECTFEVCDLTGATLRSNKLRVGGGAKMKVR